MSYLSLYRIGKEVWGKGCQLTFKNVALKLSEAIMSMWTSEHCIFTYDTNVQTNRFGSEYAAAISNTFWYPTSLAPDKLVKPFSDNRNSEVYETNRPMNNCMNFGKC